MSQTPFTVSVFFNRPNDPIDLSALIEEIERSKESVVVASAWFTDTKIASALVRSNAKYKLLLANRSDVERGSKRAYQMCNDAKDIVVVTLGSPDWQQGVMHHKFIITDFAVWTGSYNFTFQARSNYENLIRIDGPGIHDIYKNEVDDLLSLRLAEIGSEGEPPQSGATPRILRPGMFRCDGCKQYKPHWEAQPLDTGPDMICRECQRKFWGDPDDQRDKDVGTLPAKPSDEIPF